MKRAHGADEAEVQRLEDEAFGPPARPDDADPFAEAPTEFLTAPGTGADEAAADAAGSERRLPDIADLQEAPPPSDEAAPAAEQTIPAPRPEVDSAAETEAEIDGGHSTEERHAIAEQPTEFFDVAAELDTDSESRSPSDEQLLDAELAEPRLAPVDPLHGIVDTGPDAEVVEDEEDDFFSEQRLSDELNQALEAPLTEEEEQIFAPPADEQPKPAPLAPVEEEESVEEDEERELELEPAGPRTDEHEAIPPAEEATAIYDIEEDAEDEGGVEPPPPDASHTEPEPGPEDVLEDTPDFLEDAPEDDDLWFEQKPPKDFDFDD
ncbi:MAG: hypothetical protein H0X42_12815 [Solirubrobacterales bacterium]|nr:hypothetical protein [Solirubrobacterales bacterium]